MRGIDRTALVAGEFAVVESDRLIVLGVNLADDDAANLVGETAAGDMVYRQRGGQFAVDATGAPLGGSGGCGKDQIVGIGQTVAALGGDALIAGAEHFAQFGAGVFGVVRGFDDYAKLESLIDANTKLLFCESIGNPAGNVVDIAKLADIAHRHGVPLVVDNTVATPYLCRVFDLGADIAVHSLTKYIGGHGTTIGGAIVDSGKFDWAANAERFPVLNQPDPSYHGVVYTEALGEAAFIGRARVVPLRNTGAALSAQSAFQIMQGLETLALRMDRHCENAQKVAEYLSGHDKVSWVNYAGLADSPYHDTCQRLMGGRASGILSFGIQGGREAGGQFIDALQLILRLVNIGDAKSLACHPASTTHRQLNPDELAAAGVSEDLVRISVGIEHIDDIIADIEQALAAV